MLDHIAENGGATQAQIIRGTGLSPTAVNGAINQLKLAERITYQSLNKKHHYFVVDRVRAPRLTAGTVIEIEEGGEQEAPRKLMTKAERQDIALAELRAKRKAPSIFTYMNV